MDPPFGMKTGFDPLTTHEQGSEDALILQVKALMLAFSRDACVVAGRCTLADGRTSVTDKDMRDALMYCARTFFEKNDDDIRTLVNDAVQFLHDDEDDNESDEEDESETEDGESDDDDDHEEEYESCEGSAASDADAGGETTSEQDIQLRRHVQTVVNTWSLWEPVDPVHVLVKRAIDQIRVPVTDTRDV